MQLFEGCLTDVERYSKKDNALFVIKVTQQVYFNRTMGFGAYFKTITSIIGPKEGFSEVIGTTIKLVSQYYC